MDATCTVCQTVFDAKRSTAKYCSSTCRSRGNRAGIATVEALPDRPAGLVEAIRRELGDAERLDTVLGQQALELASRIVSPLSTGAGVATLSRELRQVMADATAGAAIAADPLDELRARRDKLRAAR